MVIRIVLLLLILMCLAVPVSAALLASSNIPLDSPIYLYLEKLSGMGLVRSDVRGLKPFSRSEAARLTIEASENLRLGAAEERPAYPAARAFLKQLKTQLARELSLYNTDSKPRLLDATPVLSARMRYVYLQGVPRSYERKIGRAHV